MHGLLRSESDPSATGHIFSMADRNQRLTSSGVSSLGIVCAQYDAHTDQNARDLFGALACSLLAAILCFQLCIHGRNMVHAGGDRIRAPLRTQGMSCRTPAILWFKSGHIMLQATLSYRVILARIASCLVMTASFPLPRSAPGVSAGERGTFGNLAIHLLSSRNRRPEPGIIRLISRTSVVRADNALSRALSCSSAS